MKALAIKDQPPCPDVIARIDWDFLEVLLEVMEPFAAATAAMEVDKTPIIVYVLGKVVFLRKQMKELVAHVNPAISAAAKDMQAEFVQR